MKKQERNTDKRDRIEDYTYIPISEENNPWDRERTDRYITLDFEIIEMLRTIILVPDFMNLKFRGKG